MTDPSARDKRRPFELIGLAAIVAVFVVFLHRYGGFRRAVLSFDPMLLHKAACYAVWGL